MTETVKRQRIRQKEKFGMNEDFVVGPGKHCIVCGTLTTYAEQHRNLDGLCDPCKRKGEPHG